MVVKKKKQFFKLKNVNMLRERRSCVSNFFLITRVISKKFSLIFQYVSYIEKEKMLAYRSNLGAAFDKK